MTLGSATAVITIALLRAGSTINLSPGIRSYNIVFLKFTAIASSSGVEGAFKCINSPKSIWMLCLTYCTITTVRFSSQNVFLILSQSNRFLLYYSYNNIPINHVIPVGPSRLSKQRISRCIIPKIIHNSWSPIPAPLRRPRESIGRAGRQGVQ